MSRIALSVSIAALAGCTAPVFKDAPPSAERPLDVAGEPERYHDTDVLWGGKIIAVRNLEGTTEVQVVAYPLDDAQRPLQAAPTEGRFIVALPGYVEALDYPLGRFVTLRGQVHGTRSGRVDDHDYVFPLVENATVHLWPVNFPYERPRISFGIGVGLH